MAAHRYWRIKAHIACLANPTNNALSLSEVAVKDTGGTDRTSAATITVDASSSGSAADLYDASSSTRWVATDAEHTIKLDFGGSTYDLTTFILTPPDNPYRSTAPAMMEFQYSDDDAAWSTSFYGCVNFSDWSAGALTFTKPATLVEARYWALFITDTQVTATPSIAEIEMRTAVSGADVTGSGTAKCGTSAPYIGSFGPDNAFDNSDTSPWWVSGHTSRDWIGYDFGTGNNKRIVEIAVRCIDHATYYAYAPTTCAMLASADGRSFAHMWNVDFSSTWTQGQQRVSANGAPPDPLPTGRRKLFTPS